MALRRPWGRDVKSALRGRTCAIAMVRTPLSPIAGDNVKYNDGDNDNDTTTMACTSGAICSRLLSEKTITIMIIRAAPAEATQKSSVAIRRKH